MSANINKVLLSGRLTRDPEPKSTKGGLYVLGFGIAVNDSRKNQGTGEWEDVPNFVECAMFGAHAQAIERHLSKGSKVAVEGRLHWSQWEKDGQRRSRLDVTVEKIELMSGSRAAGEATAEAAAEPVRAAEPPTAYTGSIYDSDIPF